jgi:hypothetical protein
VLWEVKERYFKDNPIVAKHIEVARFAVQKQIPLKCKSYGRHYECANCRGVIIDRTECCPKCGQKFSWESDT